MAGTWCTNLFGFKPQLTTQGTTDKADFDTSMDRIDAKLGEFKVFGDPGYEDLATALTTIGSTDTTLTIPSTSGAVAVGADATIPANVDLRVAKGSYFDVANGVTLTIQGSIDAGPYQIFSWSGTGTVDISGSPTEKPFLNWWGAVPDATAGAGAECSAIIQKAYSGMGNHQTLKLVEGWYTAAHFSLTSLNRVYSLEGSGKIGNYGAYADGIWITGDTSTDGITFGVANNTMQKVKLSKLNFGGPAACCRNGVVVNMAVTELDNVNVWMGASDYGMKVIGSIPGDLKLTGYHMDAASEAGPAGVLHLTYNQSPMWESNGTNINVRCNGTAGSFSKPPVYLQGVRSVSGNYRPGVVMSLTGIIDQVDADYALHVVNGVLLNINELYCETDKDILIDGSNSINMNGILVTEGKIVLSNSSSIYISGYNTGGIRILPDCSAIVVGVGQMQNDGVVEDYAGDTIFLNGPEHYPTYNSDPHNYIYNADFSRWNTSDAVADGGWYKFSTSTWAQCTGTQVDGTTAHVNTYYAQVVFATGGSGQNYYLDATQLSKFLGKTLTWSYWQNYPTGQSFDHYYEMLGVVNFTVPARANSTVYNIGEAVTYGGDTYLCVGATGSKQSAGSPPTFDTDGGTTTDGDVIWRDFYWLTTSSQYNNPPTTSDGVWRLVSATQFIPRNATAIDVAINQPAQTGGADSTMYIAEPAIMIGRQVQRTPIQSNPLRSEVGGIVLWPVTPTAGLWVEVGDIDLSSGQRCTTAGIQGTTAVWSNFP